MEVTTNMSDNKHQKWLDALLHLHENCYLPNTLNRSCFHVCLKKWSNIRQEMNLLEERFVDANYKSKFVARSKFANQWAVLISPCRILTSSRCGSFLHSASASWSRTTQNQRAKTLDLWEKVKLFCSWRVDFRSVRKSLVFFLGALILDLRGKVKFFQRIQRRNETFQKDCSAK